MMLCNFCILGLTYRWTWFARQYIYRNILDEFFPFCHKLIKEKLNRFRAVLRSSVSVERGEERTHNRAPSILHSINWWEQCLNFQEKELNCHCLPISHWIPLILSILLQVGSRAARLWSVVRFWGQLRSSITKGMKKHLTLFDIIHRIALASK